MGGMIMSETTALTIFPNAAPMITPTARSTTLPRMANALNSSNMGNLTVFIIGFPSQSSLSTSPEKINRRF